MDDGSGTANGIRSGVTEAAHFGDERTTVLGFLQRQRDLVAWKLAGPSDTDLRSVATATGLTLHGIVRHLTNVERSWIRDVFAAEPALAFDWSDDDPDAEMRVPVTTSMAELLGEYAAESRRCDVVIAAVATLDQDATSRGVSLRWILNHLVEETARHLGHIDLLLEQATGVVGEEPEFP
jgi:uncharacterized damage-inducible protein DinB